MRALIYDGKSPRLQPRYDEPTLQSGEAMIRPTLTGVCSTDLEICKGYMGLTGVLGHEFVGIVEELADDCPDRYRKLIGRRVVGGINCVCGKCDMCAGGLSTHCRQRTVLGIDGRDGCFAERFTLPAVNLLEVPDHVDDDRAVFCEPVAAALQARKQLHVEGEPYITVLGDGRLGLLTAQVMAKLNVSVRVIGKHERKLALCEKWGIKHRLISDVSPRADQDVVVDCTGSAEGLKTAMAMVRPRGKIILKTTVAGPCNVNLAPLVIHEIELIGSRCGSMAEGLAAIAADEVEVLSLITRRVKLDDGPKALQLAADPDHIKVLIEID